MGQDFTEKLRQMLDAYFETELLFIELSRIIPLDSTPDTYSPRLYEILQSSCGQVENLLRLLCDRLELKYEQKIFPCYYKALNQTSILERQLVSISIGDYVYSPFKLDAGKETPNWWTGYNDTKHDLPQGYKQGNLGNTVVALSGVYALHCMSVYVKTIGKDILDNSNWNEAEAVAVNTLNPFRDPFAVDEDYRPRSRIFYCMSYFRSLHGL